MSRASVDVINARRFAGVVDHVQDMGPITLNLACGHVSTEANPHTVFMGYIRLSNSSMFKCGICHYLTRVHWVKPEEEDASSTDITDADSRKE